MRWRTDEIIVGDKIEQVKSGEEPNLANLHNITAAAGAGGAQLIMEIAGPIVRFLTNQIAQPRRQPGNVAEGQSKTKSADSLNRIGPIYKTTSDKVRKETGRMYELTDGVKKTLIAEDIPVDEFTDDAILALNQIVQNSPGIVGGAAARKALSDLPMTDLQGSINSGKMKWDAQRQQTPTDKLIENQEARAGRVGPEVQGDLRDIDAQQLQAVEKFIAEMSDTNFFKKRLASEDRMYRAQGKKPYTEEEDGMRFYSEAHFPDSERKILAQSDIYEDPMTPAPAGAIIKQQAVVDRPDVYVPVAPSDRYYPDQLAKIFDKPNLTSKDIDKIVEIVEDSTRQVRQLKESKPGKINKQDPDKDIKAQRAAIKELAEEHGTDPAAFEEQVRRITNERKQFRAGRILNQNDNVMRLVIERLDDIKDPHTKNLIISKLKSNRTDFYRYAKSLEKELEFISKDFDGIESPAQMSAYVDNLMNMDAVLNPSQVKKIRDALARNMSNAVDVGIQVNPGKDWDRALASVEVDRAGFPGSSIGEATALFRQQVLRKTVLPRALRDPKESVNTPEIAAKLKLISDHLDDTLDDNMPTVRAAFGFNEAGDTTGARYLDRKLRRLQKDLRSIAQANYGNWNQTQQQHFAKKVEVAFTHFSDTSDFPVPTSKVRTQLQSTLHRAGDAIADGMLGGTLMGTAAAFTGIPEVALATGILGGGIVGLLSAKGVLGRAITKTFGRAKAAMNMEDMIEGAAPFAPITDIASRSGTYPAAARAGVQAGVKDQLLGDDALTDEEKATNQGR